MTRSERTGARMLLRVTTAIISTAVLFVVLVIAPSIPTASAGKEKIAVFGTVFGTPQSDRIDVATRSGVLTLTIDEDTKISGKKRRVALSDVEAGMTVAGYYVESDDGPVAVKLKFVARKQKTSYEHVIGVILEINGSVVTVKTYDGEVIEIDYTNVDGGLNAELGSLVAMVVEHDAATGHYTATALQTAKETVERLSKSIGYEISAAQRELLRIRMSETAAVHMTRLYETLDEIKIETQAKINAAYAEFQASYEATLRESSSEPITVEMSGIVLSVFASELHVLSFTDGTRWAIRVTDSTTVVLPGGIVGTIMDIQVGQIVAVFATPGIPPAWPVAKIIRVISVSGPDPAATATPVPDDDTITGTIVVIDDGTGETGTVVVVVSDDGTDSAAALTDDTVITVDGEQLSADQLELGQEVEIVLGPDGFSAEEVTAVEPVPGGGTSVAPSEYTLIGTLRSFGATGVILDGVQLTPGRISTTWDSTTVGQQVELKFFLDNQGRLVVTGTK